MRVADEIAAPEYDARPVIRQLMSTLAGDLPRLHRIDRYIHGDHDKPYLPSSEDPELQRLLAKAVLNLMDHAVETPAEKLYVDSVRPGRDVDPNGDLPEWKHWQLSRLDSRQTSVYKSALGYGHCFTVTEPRRGKVQTKSLSPLKTSALFEDPANDETPYAALTVTSWPEKGRVGVARVWDDVNEYLLYFERIDDTENILVTKIGPHGASSCPVTRFAAYVDTEGRTLGVVEPLIALQDRINQTVYNLLVVETGGAYKVKTISGMAPPLKMKREIDRDGAVRMVPVFDEDGNPVLDKIRVNPAMILFAENKDTKFGTLDHTPLDGYLQSVKDAIRQFTSKSRVPPHFMLGEIANLSADALQALNGALESRVGGFRQVFGESWERVFRLAAELDGVAGAIDDYAIEVLWRDTEERSLAQVADGLFKLRQAGVPLKAIIEMVPGMTKTMKADWLEWMDEEAQEAKEQQQAADAQAAFVASAKAASATATTPKKSASSKPADKVP
jgi:hypothetical protein